MMTLNLPARDRWLCAILPAVITVALYAFTGARTLQRQCRMARAELDLQPPAAAREARLDAARREAARLEDQVRTERERAAAPGGAGSRGAAQGPGARDAAWKAVTDVCTSQGMTLFKAERIGGPAAGAHGAADPERWRLRLGGSYEAMVHVLDAIAEGPGPVVPVALTLSRPHDDGGYIDWGLEIDM